MWAKGLKEMSRLMNLDYVKLFSQMTREQPTKQQVTMKFINNSNPNNTMNIVSIHPSGGVIPLKWLDSMAPYSLRTRFSFTLLLFFKKKQVELGCKVSGYWALALAKELSQVLWLEPDLVSWPELCQQPQQGKSNRGTQACSGPILNLYSIPSRFYC